MSRWSFLLMIRRWWWWHITLSANIRVPSQLHARWWQWKFLQMVLPSSKLMTVKLKWRYKIKTATATAEFHDNPKFRLLQVTAKVASTEFRIDSGKDFDFLLDVFDFILSTICFSTKWPCFNTSPNQSPWSQRSVWSFCQFYSRKQRWLSKAIPLEYFSEGSFSYTVDFLIEVFRIDVRNSHLCRKTVLFVYSDS